MSVRLSTGLPRACSGLMYAAVPRTTPAFDKVAVRVDGISGSLSAAFGPNITVARPKSSTLTTPCGVTFTLAGFRSR